MSADRKYLALVLAHILIGILIYEIPVASKCYAFSILIAGIYFTVKNKNANQEILYACAYIVGCEVFLRMTNGNPDHEFGKFSVMLFSLLGIYYSGFLRKSWPFWVLLLLLIPGVILGLNSLEAMVRTKIIFYISGPVCLAVCSIYTLQRKITAREINNILLTIGLPIISCCVYLFLCSPDINTVRFDTESSFVLSGGFGPNQVATALGLGMVVFCSRLILKSMPKVYFILNLAIATYICYRGFLTFSRGGILVAFITIIVMLFFAYRNSKPHIKKQLHFKALLVFASFSAVFLLTSYQSNGLVEKRYSNEDKHGKSRDHKITGRLSMTLGEIEMFKENPVFGVGAAGGNALRFKTSGKKSSSHNEITRMLAEHGIPGIIALLVLFLVPAFLFFKQKQHLYVSAFFVFWLLTVSHTGMRTAAPSFLYALALFCIVRDEKEISEKKIVIPKRGGDW